MEQLLALKDTANWNQVASDWARVMEFQPDGCFGLLAGTRLASTATALTYHQELAWIGMVLTLPEFRGRGYASRLMTQSIEFLQAAGVTEVKLDATNLGIEIYRRFGFVDECPIERWERKPAPFATAPETRSFMAEWPADLDLEAFGTDRSKVLTDLRQTGSLVGCESGYAMSRDGARAAYLGPCVARDAGTARALMASLIAPLADSAVYWDLFPDNSAAAGIAREFGFQPVRHLTRMTRVLAPHRQRIRPDNSLVYAIAGFELG